MEDSDERTNTNAQFDPTRLLIFGWDGPNHPLNHTRVKREYLKRNLPPEKFEQLIRFTYTDDCNMLLSSSLNDHDTNDNEKAILEK